MTTTPPTDHHSDLPLISVGLLMLVMVMLIMVPANVEVARAVYIDPIRANAPHQIIVTNDHLWFNQVDLNPSFSRFVDGLPTGTRLDIRIDRKASGARLSQILRTVNRRPDLSTRLIVTRQTP